MAAAPAALPVERINLEEHGTSKNQKNTPNTGNADWDRIVTRFFEAASKKPVPVVRDLNAEQAVRATAVRDGRVYKVLGWTGVAAGGLLTAIFLVGILALSVSKFNNAIANASETGQKFAAFAASNQTVLLSCSVAGLSIGVMSMGGGIISLLYYRGISKRLQEIQDEKASIEVQKQSGINSDIAKYKTRLIDHARTANALQTEQTSLKHRFTRLSAETYHDLNAVTDILSACTPEQHSLLVAVGNQYEKFANEELKSLMIENFKVADKNEFENRVLDVAQMYRNAELVCEDFEERIEILEVNLQLAELELKGFTKPELPAEGVVEESSVTALRQKFEDKEDLESQISELEDSLIEAQEVCERAKANLDKFLLASGTISRESSSDL